MSQPPPRPLSDRAAELLLDALFVEVRPAPLERLRASCAIPDDDWQDVPAAAELHGVLPLVARNLQLAGAEPPESIAATLHGGAERLREEGRRDALTLGRTLAAARAAGVELTLLKGASLAQDVYLDPLLRSQGDVDLLVSRAAVTRAVKAAAEAGLYLHESQLPVWWYRLAHFHLKLFPGVAILKELELHWWLHHPALLLTPKRRAVLARRVALEVDGEPALTLDPLDRALHLITHLTSHWVGVPKAWDRAWARGLLQNPPYPVRLKWVLDLLLVVEGLAERTPAGELVRRSAEWNADSHVIWCLRMLESSFEPAPGTSRWIGEALAELAPGPPPKTPPETNGAQAAPRSHSERAHATLGFRSEALRLLPRWAFPPDDYLARRYELSTSAPLAIVTLVGARAWHAGVVLLRAALTALALPVAFAGRALARRRRRRRFAQAMAPEAVLDVVEAWSAAARARER